MDKYFVSMSLNITFKQTTIKLGPHKGEEMYVLNNACQDYLL